MRLGAFIRTLSYLIARFPRATHEPATRAYWQAGERRPWAHRWPGTTIITMATGLEG